MNGCERVLAAMNGRQVDRIPVMLHNFMMAAREAGISMRQYRRDAAAIAGSFARAVETYDYDAVVMDIDTTVLAGAVGVPVDYPEDEPARCCGAMLGSLDQVRDLTDVDLTRDAAVQTALEAVARLREQFGGQIAIRGNCDQCPFSLASMMRGPEQWFMDLLDGDQYLVRRLLEYCSDITGQFIDLMARAGADIVSNGDSPAGPDVISPTMYRTFALPYERLIAQRAKDAGVPYLLHICGNTTSILDDMVGTGSDALELDYKTDMRVAHRVIGNQATFVGNIDPSGVLTFGTVKSVERQTAELLAVFADTPRFILNAGCAIPATTPAENLRAMIRVARRG